MLLAISKRKETETFSIFVFSIFKDSCRKCSFSKFQNSEISEFHIYISECIWVLVTVSRPVTSAKQFGSLVTSAQVIIYKLIWSSLLLLHLAVWKPTFNVCRPQSYLCKATFPQNRRTFFLVALHCFLSCLLPSHPCALEIRSFCNKVLEHTLDA